MPVDVRHKDARPIAVYGVNDKDLALGDVRYYGIRTPGTFVHIKQAYNDFEDCIPGRAFHELVRDPVAAGHPGVVRSRIRREIYLVPVIDIVKSHEFRTDGRRREDIITCPGPVPDVETIDIHLNREMAGRRFDPERAPDRVVDMVITAVIGKRPASGALEERVVSHGEFYRQRNRIVIPALVPLRCVVTVPRRLRV